jgi:hypothetical protein
MVQIPKPVLRLRLGFSGETLLCLANIIHTSTECPFGLFHWLRTLKFLSNPCGPSPCDGFSPSPTTMTAPTPFHHFNYSLSSPLQGGWSGLPRSLSNPLRRSVGSSCTPVRCLLTPSSSSASLHLVSHCRFAYMERLFHCIPCDNTVTR